MSAPTETARSLEAAVARWDLRLEGPPVMSASGCVAFGRRGAQPVVVKVLAPGSDEGQGIEALRHFGGQGSVALLAATTDAALLERAQPGIPLSRLVHAGRDDEATAALCEVVAALHRVPAPVGAAAAGYPNVERWGEAFRRYRRAGATTLPARLVERAAAVYEELAASQGERRLLHGDLHHDNILLDHARGWLAIDPKGVLGEPAYELGAALRNPAFVPTPALTDRRVGLIVERLGLDRRRLLAWGFAQAVLSAVWAWEDGAEADFAVAAIEAIRAVR
jgi:streptomycin 6-kinase